LLRLHFILWIFLSCAGFIRGDSKLVGSRKDCQNGAKVH
jgi:hypothetical protein